MKYSAGLYKVEERMGVVLSFQPDIHKMDDMKNGENSESYD